MRIACLGGGPGGLFFSALLKARRPDAEITVFERNPADATYGFGVVFSRPTLRILDETDPATYEAIASHGEGWEDLEIRRRGERLRIDGNGYIAIARKELLRILQERAVAAGVDVRFEADVEGLEELRAEGWDMIVAADGVNSLARRELAPSLEPEVAAGESMFIWFGTPQTFDALTFSFVENEHGVFATHAYPFAPGKSTFIVETDKASWRRAGLDHSGWDSLQPGESDEVATAYCTDLFAEDLAGERLLLNNSKWMTFPTVRSRRWSHDEVVAIGDAVHTAHFSVGSGTKMAMEDAAVLADRVAELGAGREAIEEFEEVRRPRVERTQALAAPSLIWWERFPHYGSMSNSSFAFHFLTRSLATSASELESIAPRFTESSNLAGATERRLREPLTVGGLELSGSLAVDLADDGSGDEATMPTGAGLVFVSLPPTANEGSLRDSLAAARGRGPPAAGLFAPASDSSSAAKAAALATAAGADLLELDPGTDLDELGAGGRDCDVSRTLIELVAAARREWPARRPLGLRIGVRGRDNRRPPRGLAEIARELRSDGVDMFTLRADPDHESSRTRTLLTADYLRHYTPMRVCVQGATPTLGQAATVLLAERADLCRGIVT